MSSRIIPLADVENPTKNKNEERRKFAIEKCLRSEFGDFEYMKCLSDNALRMLENGTIVWSTAALDTFYSMDNCTDILWLIEFDTIGSTYYTLLKLSTEPHEDDLAFGYSHMVFERYDFEVLF